MVAFSLYLYRALRYAAVFCRRYSGSLYTNAAHKLQKEQSIDSGAKINSFIITFLQLSHLRPAVVTGCPDEANAGKKEDSTQKSIHDQTFDLPFCTACSHKDDGKIDQGSNA